MTVAVSVTLAIFAAGIIYQTGKLSARVESLEAWRLELRADLKGIYSAIDDVKRLIMGIRS